MRRSAIARTLAVAMCVASAAGIFEIARLAFNR